MARTVHSPAENPIQRLFEHGTLIGLADGQLLQRFLDDPAGGEGHAAFEAIVRRHGPMVIRVCRSVLHNAADAEDAFQATFVVLARRAVSVRRRESLACWLYGVALRTASCARSAVARRARLERRAAAMTPEISLGNDRSEEGSPRLIAEVARLPEKYRVPILLCYFEGHTHASAAEQLGWPLGTVEGRLARARNLLRARLAGDGDTALHSLDRPSFAESALSAPLVASTLKSVTSHAAGATLGSASVAILARKVLVSMTFTKIKLATGALLAIAIVATGAWQAASSQRRGNAVSTPATPRRPPPAPAPHPDRAALVGGWQLISAERDGRPVPLREAPIRQLRVESDGRAAVATSSAYVEAALTLGRPGAGMIDLAIHDPRPLVNGKPDFSSPSFAGPLGGKTLKGLYRLADAPLRLEGTDRLMTLCLADPDLERPGELTSKGGRTLYTFERVGAAAQAVSAADSPASRYQRIVHEYFGSLQRLADSDATPQRNASPAASFDASPYAERCLNLAREHATDPAALDALTFALQLTIGRDANATTRRAEVIRLIRDGWLTSDRLGLCFPIMGLEPSPAAEDLLRRALAESPSQQVRGEACLALARYLGRLGDIAQTLHDNPGLAADLNGRGTPELLAYFKAIDSTVVRTQSETLLARARDEFGSLPLRGEQGREGITTIGQAASDALLISVGHPAPAIDGPDLDGRPLRLDDYRGKVVALVFWGFWCGPCREMIPHEKELVRRFEGRDFALLGVNSDSNPAVARTRMADEGMSWRCWTDHGADGPIADRWGIDAWPAVFVLDRDGVIRFRNIRGADLDRAIDQLLGEATARP